MMEWLIVSLGRPRTGPTFALGGRAAFEGARLLEFLLEFLGQPKLFSFGVHWILWRHCAER
jgi:hypothetical protein